LNLTVLGVLMIFRYVYRASIVDTSLSTMIWVLKWGTVRYDLQKTQIDKNANKILVRKKYLKRRESIS